MSIGIIMEELQKDLVAALAAGQTFAFCRKLPIQYRDFVILQERFPQREEHSPAAGFLEGKNLDGYQAGWGFNRETCPVPMMPDRRSAELYRLCSRAN